jgi:hypothetical protein
MTQTTIFTEPISIPERVLAARIIQEMRKFFPRGKVAKEIGIHVVQVTLVGKMRKGASAKAIRKTLEYVKS